MSSSFILSRQSRKQKSYDYRQTDNVASDHGYDGIDCVLGAQPAQCVVVLRRDHRDGHTARACYTGRMPSFLYSRGIGIFDYPKFANLLRNRIQSVYAANSVSIEHINKSLIRKEDLLDRVLAVRGNAPSMVRVIGTDDFRPARSAPCTAHTIYCRVSLSARISGSGTTSIPSSTNSIATSGVVRPRMLLGAISPWCMARA